MSSFQGSLLGVKSFNHVWTINEFSKCMNQFGLVAQSPLFPANNFPRWRVRIYRQHRAHHLDFEMVYHREEMFPHREPKIFAKYRLSVLNDKGEKVKSFDSDFCTFTQKEPVSTTRFMSMIEADTPVYRDKFTIVCEVSVVTMDSHNTQDFGAIFDSKKWSDVTLVVDGLELKAHKAVLASRSQVFAAMFEHELEEQQLNRVSITDIKHDVLVEMLHYMYTGISPNLAKVAQELIAAADKYALESLKKMCVEALQKNISISTAVNTLILADRHNEEKLKSEVIDFIANNVTSVMATEGWDYLSTNHGHFITKAFVKLHENYMRIKQHHCECECTISKI